MTISTEMLNAYNYHHREFFAKPHKNAFDAKSAAACFHRARFGIINNEPKHYCERGVFTKPYPAVSWQPMENPRSSERLAYIDNPANAGLRFVGRVTADCGNRNGYWDSRDQSGWYTDPYGDVFNDGSGLCYGVVYQLSGKDGKARFVAGYQFGGVDGGPTLDLSTVYEGATVFAFHTYKGEFSHWSYESNPADMEAARDAARAADSMAQRAADEEREYQTAWQAGSQYADCVADLKRVRKSVLETIAAIKANCATLRELPAKIRDILKSDIASELSERSATFEKMDKLANGDFPPLEFYPDNRLRAAFNEGAGCNIL